ncbi:MAG: transglycosylase SLT domain-containing protein [Bacilli bacterium]
MARSIIIKLDNEGNLNECYFISGKKQISLNGYLIRTNRILNSFDNIKYRRISFNEYEIIDPKVIKLFISKIPNLKKSLKNSSKKVIISTTILATLLTGANAIKNEQKNNKDNEPIIDSFIEIDKPNLENLNENNISYESDIVYTLDFNDYTYNLDNKDVSLYTVDYLTQENKVNDNNQKNNSTENDIIIDDTLLKNEDIPVFSFDYEDRSESEKISYAKENYQEYVDEYAKMYGLDNKLVMAILTQENAYNTINNSNVGANGVMQIESIWYNQNITAYNYENDAYETECINANNLSNPEYSIKIGCMILNNYYNTIYNNYYKNNILSKSDCILATMLAYNKGITAICNLINSYNSNYLNHINETIGGDNDYLKHVSSYLSDMTTVEIENLEDDSSKIIFDNLTR